MLPKKHREAFDHFCETAYDDGILGAKTTLLLKLATAMVVGCYP